MKHRILALSKRALAPRAAQTWTCRRCLAQSAVAPIAGDDFITPPATPQQSHDTPTSSIFSRTTLSTHTSPSDAEIPISTKQKEPDAQDRATFEERFLGQDDQTLTDEQRTRRKELLEVLERDIRHPIPSQYLTHVDIAALTPTEQEQRIHLYQWAMAGHVNDKGEPKERSKEIKGVVVSAGKMDRTVKVRLPGQRWEPRIKKYYASHTDHLVHDPNNSLLEGDIVILHRLKVSKLVKHVVGSVPVPYGKPLAERPPIPTSEERLAEYKERRFAKFERQELRKRAATGDEEAISALKAMGYDDSAVSKKDKTAGKQKSTSQKSAAKLKSKAENNIDQARSKKVDTIST